MHVRVSRLVSTIWSSKLTVQSNKLLILYISRRWKARLLTPIVPGVVWCTVVVGGYWVIDIFVQILGIRVFVGIDGGGNLVAFPVGRVMA